MHSVVCPNCGSEVIPAGAHECPGCFMPITEPILPRPVRSLATMAKLFVAAVGALGVLKFLALMWREGYRAAAVTIVLLPFVGIAVSEYQRSRKHH